MINKLKRPLIWLLIWIVRIITFIILIIMHFGSKIVFKKELWEWMGVGDHVGSSKMKRKVLGKYYTGG